MESSLKRKLAVGVSALAVLAFAGGAFAAAQDPATRGPQAFLADVAKRLGVSPTALKAALQGAFFDRLDAAVAAGKLTKAQADQIKRRAQQDPNFPLGFLHAEGAAGGFGPRFFGPDARPHFVRPGLAAAAKYLGVSEAELMRQFQAGKSLAQIAASRGKSITGLRRALHAPEQRGADGIPGIPEPRDPGPRGAASGPPSPAPGIAFAPEPPGTPY